MMERVVLDFLESLDAAQRRRAVLPFASPERFNWHYVPRERKGISLHDMTEGQRRAAMSVLRVALSERGYRRCEDIMRLETLVAAIEQDPETYHPTHYAFTVFGHPGNGAPWGWRVDGHHLSLNFVHRGDETTVTPTFYGAHPANVEHGSLAGLRVLGAEEDLGRQLIASLDGHQRDVALIRETPFEDIITGPGREQSLKRRAGLAAGKMKEMHRNMLMRIIEEFIGTMAAPVAEAERARLRSADIHAIHFAWAGSLEPRRPHYYRLHGPTLVIEYDNTQNDANHIHSVWHDPTREFGADVLRRHYEHGRHERSGHKKLGQ